MSFKFNPFTGALDLTSAELQSGASRVFVDQSTGSDTTGNGSVMRPFAGLIAALASLTPGTDYEIILAPGTYNGADIAWPEDVALTGSAGGHNTHVDHNISFTATNEEAKFYFSNVSVNPEITFDLSAVNVCIPALVDGSYNIARVPGGGAATLIVCKNSSIGGLELEGTAILEGCTFLGGGYNVRSGGVLLLLGGLVGSAPDLYGTASVTAMGAYLAGGVTGHTVGLNTPVLNTDASSPQGAVTGVTVNYFDNASRVAYTPALSGAWPEAVPATVKAALDTLASRNGINLDGGTASSIYGGIPPINGGSA